MPIPAEELQTQFMLVSADEVVGAVLEHLPETLSRRFTYLVLPAEQGRYTVVRWFEIEQIAETTGEDIRWLRLADLSGLPQPSAAVEQASMGLRAARELRDQQPNRRLVVLANGAVIGLLVQETLAAPVLPPALSPDPVAEATPPDFVLRPIDRAETEPPAPPKPAEDDRVINAWVENLAPGEALHIGESYDLKFNVDRPRFGAFTADIDVNALFSGLPPEVQRINVQVVLDTDDFEILGESQQTLVVPRVGKSRNTVTFAIEPKHNGAATIRALFFANDRVFQRMTLTFQVGATASEAPVVAIAASGRTFGSALALAPRPQSVDLVIMKKDAGYEFLLRSGGFSRATVNLSEPQIADLILYAREELKKIVYQVVDGQYIYQRVDTSIPASVHSATLDALAALGSYLYEAIFYAPGNSATVRMMGDLLRQQSQHERLHIQVVAERFVFPWALLYDRESFTPGSVDPEGFLGFKHILEHAPEFGQPSPIKFNPRIQVDQTLNLSYVYNATIDAELARHGFPPPVQTQLDFLRSLPGITLSEHPNSTDLYALLNHSDGPTQLIYFYCHAESRLPGETGGVDASRVLLSDGAVQLRDLKIHARLSGPALQSAPLVFLNACQSAELSPYLYDGLVPYLIGKGARGVLGTEVDTPALFAAEFAQTFLQRFVAGGQSLGELLLALRREYLFEKNNVMGLVYALHCSGDLVVER